MGREVLYTKQTEISRATFGRIPLYLSYLRTLDDETATISATTLAGKVGLGEVQVRKDLGAISGAGRPKVGCAVRELIKSLEARLGSSGNTNVVVVGAGRLGRALLDYGGFKAYGLNLSAAFDIAVEQAQESACGKPILPMRDLEAYCTRHDIRIAILTVPADCAQTVCDRLLRNGVRAFWCFAPCTLSVPPEVTVKYENMALSLAYLNKNTIANEGDLL